MRLIEKHKKNEPRSLKQLRKKGGKYTDLRGETKEAVRNALLDEQGHLCCYCLRRINKLEIEHIQSQKNYPEKDLEYTNLIASCVRDASQDKILHCNAAKGSTEIVLNPTDENLMKSTYFTADGYVHTKQTELQQELDIVLNLNNYRLTQERKNLYQLVFDEIHRLFPNKTVSKAFLEKRIKDFSEKKNEKYEQHCQVAIYFLAKKLGQSKK
jgi:uncharacterized protein (TIGR02646 family)